MKRMKLRYQTIFSIRFAGEGAPGYGHDAVPVIPKAIDDGGKTPHAELGLRAKGGDGATIQHVGKHLKFLSHDTFSFSQADGMTLPAHLIPRSSHHAA